MNTKTAEATVVIHMEGGQVSRIVSSQGVRVIVLDGSTTGAGKEDVSRLLSVGSDQFFVTDVQVSGAVDRTAVGEQGVDGYYCDGIVKAVEAMPVHHQSAKSTPSAPLGGFPIIESVKAKHWEDYGVVGKPMTHQIDIDDQRLSNGQVYVTVGALEGDLDDILSITAEVNTNPQTGVEQVPCVHVHFDSDALAFSLFKLGNKILMSPETGVSIQSFNGNFRGSKETLFMIE